MLKSVLYIFLVFNFAAVQSLASVCKTKCSFVEASKSETKEHQGCHSTEESDDSKSSDQECGSICQADDLIKSDAERVDFNDLLTKEVSLSAQAEVIYLNHELAFAINTHDPPGYGFYLGLPLYIQKSSFLI